MNNELQSTVSDAPESSPKIKKRPVEKKLPGEEMSPSSETEKSFEEEIRVHASKEANSN